MVLVARIGINNATIDEIQLSNLLYANGH